MIVKIAIAKPVIVVHTKGDKMPVYLDEKDNRTEFIKKKIWENPMIAVDSSRFTTWMFAGTMGYKSETFDAYSDLIEKVATEFPNEESSDLVQEIQNVLIENENEYYKAWDDYAEKHAKEKAKGIFKEALSLSLGDKGVVEEYGYDPTSLGC